jgi:hypothetical protein
MHYYAKQIKEVVLDWTCGFDVKTRNSYINMLKQYTHS